MPHPFREPAPKVKDVEPKEPKKPFKPSSLMLWLAASGIFGVGIGVHHGVTSGLSGFGITVAIAVVVAGIIRAFEEDHERTNARDKR